MKTRITARQRESKPSRSEALCDSPSAFRAKLCLRDSALYEVELSTAQRRDVVIVQWFVVCIHSCCVIARWRDVTVHR